VRSTKKFYAHDEQSSARMGDVVRIRETRPLSKLKRWALEEIVRRSALGQLEDTAPTLPASARAWWQACSFWPPASDHFAGK